MSLLGIIAFLCWLGRDTVDPGKERLRGSDLLAQGYPAGAIAHFERALLVKDDAETRRLLADALKSVGRFDDASREYKHALTLEPKSAAAWFNFGNLLRSEFHDSRGALEAYRKASETDPNLGEAQFSLGAMLMETGDYETAVVTLQSALQVAKPDTPWRAEAESALQVARIRVLEAQGKLKPPRQ